MIAPTEATSQLQEIPQEQNDIVCGQRLHEPVLGRSFCLPHRIAQRKPPVLDRSMRLIPIYEHLIFYKVNKMAIPQLPGALKGKNGIHEKLSSECRNAKCAFSASSINNNSTYGRTADSVMSLYFDSL